MDSLRFWGLLALIFVSAFSIGTSDSTACSAREKCVPHIQCPAHFNVRPADTVSQKCLLPRGDRGLCCNYANDELSNYHNNSRRMLRSSFGSTSNVAAYLNEAKRQYAEIMANEPNLDAVRVDKGQPEDFYNKVFKSYDFSSLDEMESNHRAIEEVLASRMMQKSSAEKMDSLVGSSQATPGCIPNPPCHYRGKYRKEDGTCNNERKSLWGSAGFPMEKLLPPAYEDDVWSPRLKGKDGSLLASPRVISQALFPDVDRPHPRYNLLLMQFGQLIAHDVTQSSSIKLQDGSDVQCCTKDGSGPVPQSLRHFGCLPVPVPKNDRFYRKYKQGCINFVRSALAPNPDCKLGYGRQLTKVTHYIDGSVFYGSSAKTFAKVRSFQGGKMRSLMDKGRELLPITNEKDACLFMDMGNSCFFSGDARVNQIISITALHVVFLREHNSIAERLQKLNPDWTDQVLFEETRRIVIAVFQHIIFNEYFPLIVGSHMVKKYNLQPLKSGYSNSYDPYVNPSISNEFSGAAYRFGHSAVTGNFQFHNHGALNIPDVMFNPGRLRLDYFHDAIMSTLTLQPMQRIDSSITKGLSQHMFQGTKQFGFDLISLNIQRGRDHGLRPYNDYLQLTGSKTVETFADFGFESGRKLGQVYKHPHDIDLYVGGLIESAEHDALLGPTFSEIIADQFSKFKKGDRYFYENGPDVNPGFFTPEQLQVIRQQTMARVICSNADRIALLAQSPQAFLRADLPGNEPVDCKSGYYRDIDLTPWKA